MEQENGMKSLNEDLVTEFVIKELEERLETDPMLFGTPLDASMQVTTSTGCFTCTLCFSCGEFL